MNRLEYWIKAQTQYSVHSPFVFEMYRKVLFAPLQGEEKKLWLEWMPDTLRDTVQRKPRGEQRYHQTVYKMADHYRLQIASYDTCEAVLRGGDEKGLESVKVVCRPHRDKESEREWAAQTEDEKYNISIDLYDTGLLLMHHKLHKQHFLLK